MKKMLFLLMCSVLTLLCLQPNVANASSSRNEDQVMSDFTNMQNKITSSLKVEGNHYVYDKNEVRSIVYSFDFDKLEKETGIKYSKESFLEAAITNIDATVIEHRIEPRNANKYNRNYTESGWNFRRDWMDTNYTNYFISEYRRIANDIGLIGAVGTNASKVPAIQWALGVGFAYDVWYFNNVADNTEKKNNGTGVVFEINIFTAYYSVWSQNEYKK